MPKDDTPQASGQASAAEACEDTQGQDALTGKRTSRPRTEWERLMQSRKFVLMILFFVTGALGLPLLWISAQFSATEKLLWSLANLAYTLALIALCIAICVWAYSRILMAM